MPEAYVEATPLRRIVGEESTSLPVLRESSLRYADGAEQRLASVIGAADELDSLSAELAIAAETWPETYSLSRSRANILRPLTLDRSMRVLEIGCGCGPLTRYLGEVCGQVDAVEPMTSRAEVARLRTRDQDNVRVFVGGAEDVPAEPAYDLVVVVGVLEYVAGGAGDSAVYAEFLARLHERLVDGGHLVLAIENALGVKYLAGASEDHSGIPFQSIEGYRTPGPARTFGRAALRGLLTEAGFSSLRFFGVFPDYKVPRAVFADELYEAAPQLAFEIPQWPSPDWIGVRARAAAEGALWMSLLDDGDAAPHANSHLVIARKGTQAPMLWPRERLASFFSAERARRFATQTDVVDTGGSVCLERRYLTDAPEQSGPVRHAAVGQTPLYPGTNLVTVLEPADEAKIRHWLGKWAALVASAQPDPNGMRSVDLIPQNLLVVGDAELRIIDDEWHMTATVEAVLARGALLTARQLSLRCVPDRLPGETIADVAAWLGEMVGLDGPWWEQAVQAEAAFQAVVWGFAPDDERVEEWAKGYTASQLDALATPLRMTPLGDRDGDLRRAAEAALAASRQEAQQLEVHLEQARIRDVHARASAEQSAEEIARLRQALTDAEVVLTETRKDAAGAHATIDELLSSQSWRITAPMRAASGAVSKARQHWRRG